MQNKRGQGISINTIIIAAIALIVLVVLIAIFTGRIGLFSRGVQQTEQGAYACVCNNPTNEFEEVCGNAPLIGVWIELTSPAQCNGKWSDCATTCYRKTSD